MPWLGGDQCRGLEGIDVVAWTWSVQWLEGVRYRGLEVIDATARRGCRGLELVPWLGGDRCHGLEVVDAVGWRWSMLWLEGN